MIRDIQGYRTSKDRGEFCVYCEEINLEWLLPEGVA